MIGGPSACGFSAAGGQSGEVAMSSSLWLLFFLWAGFMTGHACANDVFGR